MAIAERLKGQNGPILNYVWRNENEALNLWDDRLLRLCDYDVKGNIDRGKSYCLTNKIRVFTLHRDQKQNNRNILIRKIRMKKKIS